MSSRRCARAADGIALPDGPRRPPLGQCEWCFDDIEASHVFLPCGHAPVCAVCFIANAKAKLDTLPLRELTVRGSVYSCSHAGCDHYPSWRLTGPQLGGRDALLDVGEVTLALRAAAAALDADGAFDGGGDDDVAPARVLERWDHAVALAAAQERRERLHAQLLEDPAVRFCLDPHCQMHVIATDGGDDDGGVVSGAADEQRAALAIHSHSRGYTLDPKPLPPPLRRLKRLLTTPMSVGASLLVPVALALLVAAAAEGELIKEYVPLWQARRRVLGAALLLAALAAWQLGPRADRFALYDASAAHLARLRRELRDAHAALARANEQLGMRPVRAQMDRVRQVERAEDAVSAAEAAAEAEEALAATPELARDVGEPAGRVAFCPTCHRGQCFDCRLEWTPKGGGAMCHRGKSCEAMMSEGRGGEGEGRGGAQGEGEGEAREGATRTRGGAHRGLHEVPIRPPPLGLGGVEALSKVWLRHQQDGRVPAHAVRRVLVQILLAMRPYNDGWRGTQNYTCGTGSLIAAACASGGPTASAPASRRAASSPWGREKSSFERSSAAITAAPTSACCSSPGSRCRCCSRSAPTPTVAWRRRRSPPRSARRRSRAAARASRGLRRIGRLPRRRQPDRPRDRRRGARRAAPRGGASAARSAATAAPRSPRSSSPCGLGGASAARGVTSARGAPAASSRRRSRMTSSASPSCGCRTTRGLPSAATASSVARRHRLRRRRPAVAVAAGLLLLLCCCCAAMLNERNRRPPPGNHRFGARYSRSSKRIRGGVADYCTRT